MADYQLNAKYLTQQITRDRNLGGLISWSAYQCAQNIPTTKPDVAWVKLRYVAEQIPLQPQIWLERAMPYFLQDPQTVANIRDYLNPFNDAATESTLSDGVHSIIDYFMPRFSALTVSDNEVQAWYDANGFGAPPV